MKRSKRLTKAQAEHFEWLWHGTTQEAREKCLNAASGRTAIRQVERVLKRKLTVS